MILKRKHQAKQQQLQQQRKEELTKKLHDYRKFSEI